MKYLKYIVVLLSIVLVIIVYKLNINKEYKYVSIGDALSNYDEYVYKNINEQNKTLTKIKYNDINTLINDIEENTYINDKTIQNIIFNADLITISIGINEIDNKDLIEDMNKLLFLIRKYNTNNIKITNYYDINLDTSDINNKLKDLSDKYYIEYIDINKIFKKNQKLLYQYYPYPNKDGYLLIANSILINT